MNGLHIFATIDWNMVGATTAIYTVVSALILGFANKIFKFGQTSQKIKELEKSVDNDIKPDIKNISLRVDDLFKLVAANSVSESKSPRQLNENGKRLLKSTGIKKIVDDNYDKIVASVKKSNTSNAYRAEIAVTNAVMELCKSDKEVKSKIEEAAFENGTIPYIIITIGSLYVRDKVFKELSLNVDDIDKHKDSK